MLEAIVSGEESPERLADLALGKLRSKIPELQLALEAAFAIIIGFCWIACCVSFDSPARKPSSKASWLETKPVYRHSLLLRGSCSTPYMGYFEAAA